MQIIRKEHKKQIERLFKVNSIVAILGPRQCGKTSLAKTFAYHAYYDLENPEDLAALQNPKLAFNTSMGLIIIDEIQRRPELFTTLSYLVDTHQKIKFLILGSASRDLIKQSSETLAGRISYYEMMGFNLTELKVNSFEKKWIRGGFPKSYLAKTSEISEQWLEDYIRTYLERDIPLLGIQIPSVTLRKFWSMLSHYHGQIINYSEIGKNFGISDHTVKKYIDLLAGTFMINVVQPWFVNISKRQIKSPKFYLSDSGIFHHFIAIKNYKQLLGHPKVGASWEAFVLFELKSLYKREIYFWGTPSGAKIDFFIQHKGKNIGIECKFSDAPTFTTSMKNSIADLNLNKLYVVYLIVIYDITGVVYIVPILEDTMIGFSLEPWVESKKRKAIATGKFYFFDNGVLNHLSGTLTQNLSDSLRGSRFEHFIINEVRCANFYQRRKENINFWRSTSQFEVDLIFGSTAIEIKSTRKVSPRHLSGLKALKEENLLKKYIFVSEDPIERTVEGIQLLHYKNFLKKLWAKII